MSREIKFRAWDKKLCKYLEILQLHHGETGIEMYTLCEGCHDEIRFNPEDVILEQYTGLKDKNGVEIYENDIIQIETRSGVIESLQVIYFRGAFSVNVLDKTNYAILGKIMLTRKVEVIGNIHEVNNEL